MSLQRTSLQRTPTGERIGEVHQIGKGKDVMVKEQVEANNKGSF